MRHLDIETKAKDQGTFTAIVAAYTTDRVGEVILPGAFTNTLKRWQSSGKRIPVIWGHDSHDPENVVGYIDPADAKETADGLEVSGQIDLDTSKGKRTFELMKQGSMSYSFGYVVPPDGEREKDGHTEISEIDLMEVTVTPIPANADTRTLAFKDATITTVSNGANDSATPLWTPKEDDLIPVSERDGAIAGFLKAVWTGSYINDLPDSAFLHVESGGSKDGDGKTAPRGLRHFPYKDAGGTVDLPHLRNALSRIPQSNLPQPVKDRLMTRARALLDAQSSDLPPEIKEELVQQAERSLDQAVTDRPKEPVAPVGHDDELAGWDTTLLDSRST